MVHEGSVKEIIKEQKNTLEVKDIFIILILVIVSRVFTCSKTSNCTI